MANDPDAYPTSKQSWRAQLSRNLKGVIDYTQKNLQSIATCLDLGFGRSITIREYFGLQSVVAAGCHVLLASVSSCHRDITISVVASQRTTGCRSLKTHYNVRANMGLRSSIVGFK